MLTALDPDGVKVGSEKLGKRFAGRFDIVTRDGVSVKTLFDDILPSAGVGGEDGASAGHRFENREAESLIAGEGGDDGHSLKQPRKFGRGAAAVENDAFSESGVSDFFLQLPLVVPKFGSGFTDDHDGGSGVFLKEGNGSVDKEVDPFLGADAAEDADAEFAGEAKGLPGPFLVGGHLVAIEIDPVRDHDVGFLFKVGSGG